LAFTKKTYLQQIAGATTTPILCKSDFENIEIPVPSKVTQNNIANVLKNIDDIVFNNNKIIKELESLASDFYDYWFVQFDFPDENGKPYKSSGGKMVWNEDLKREIPEGWKIESILDYCDIIDCLHSKKPNYHFISDSSYLLTLDNLTKNGHIDVSNKYYISDSDYKKWTSNIEVKENDFVVTNAGRAGDICKIPQNVKCAIGRNITAIRPKNISPYYLQQYFKSPDMQYQVKTHLDSGSFFMSFNVKSIKVIKILVPSQKIIIQAENILKTYSIAIDNLIEENFELSSLRDFLLPLLMNGQVGFKDEERITGRNS
jgi:type I restriction enzyme S subunit